MTALEMVQLVNQRPVYQRRVRFEPYDASLGCVAMRHNGIWLVVEPNGRVYGAYGSDEAEARSVAMCRNLTATDEEIEAWRNR